MEKKLYGQYAREMGNGVDMKRTWRRFKKSDLKGCTEALICRTQEPKLSEQITRNTTLTRLQICRCAGCVERKEKV